MAANLWGRAVTVDEAVIHSEEGDVMTDLEIAMVMVVGDMQEGRTVIDTVEVTASVTGTRVAIGMVIVTRVIAMVTIASQMTVMAWIAMVVTGTAVTAMVAIDTEATAMVAIATVEVAMVVNGLMVGTVMVTTDTAMLDRVEVMEALQAVDTEVALEAGNPPNAAVTETVHPAPLLTTREMEAECRQIVTTGHGAMTDTMVGKRMAVDVTWMVFLAARRS